MASPRCSLSRTISFFVSVCLAVTGCATSHLGSMRPAAAARWSFVKFNLMAPMGPQAALDAVCGHECCAEPRSALACDETTLDGCDASDDVACGTASTQQLTKALLLMAKSSAELDQLLRCHRAPNLGDIEGPWNGINKGVGTALLGVTQDTKVFQSCSCGSDRAGSGYNIQVQQVSLCHLDRDGFQPHIDCDTGRAKTMGNFVIRPATGYRQPLVLDYTAAENGRLDPSRRLVDELVMIEPDLLLGRAHVKIGNWQIPIAYFVLYRD